MLESWNTFLLGCLEACAKRVWRRYRATFFNWNSEGWSPLDTVATSRPIMPTPGDYDDGEIVE
jgi:hypothetical protein